MCSVNYYITHPKYDLSMNSLCSFNTRPSRRFKAMELLSRRLPISFESSETSSPKISNFSKDVTDESLWLQSQSTDQKL